ncbi:MAG: carbohydrate binding domain-containing protein [Bacteroidota bacterium]
MVSHRALAFIATLNLLVCTNVPGNAQNVLTNSGFESGTGSWTFFTNGSGSYASVAPGFTGTRSARLTISAVGSNVQFYQSGRTLEPNTGYTLTFTAYSSSAHDLSLFVHGQSSPFTNYGLNNQLVNLTASWQTYTIQFTTSGFASVVNDARLRFWLASYATAGDVYFLDDIDLRKTVAAPVGPTITSHPAHASKVVGETAIFSVSVSGSTPMSFQWQRNDIDIQNATGSSHTTPVLTIDDNASTFRCVVTNAVGGDTSDTAILTVSAIDEPPLVSAQPLSQTVNAGQPAIFSIVATGPGLLGYQWERSGVNIGGATSSSYSLPSTSFSDNGSVFRCVVSNIVGSDTSNPATLTVIPTPPSSPNIVQNPGFESGTGSWTFFTNASGNFASVSPGFTGSRTARLTINSAGSNVQLYQSGLTLEPNTNYTLKFVAYSSNGKDVALSVLQQGAPNTNYGLNNRLVNLTTSWQTFTIEFTTTGFQNTVSDGRVRFWLAPYATAGTVYFLDDVELKRTVPPIVLPFITLQPQSQNISEGHGVTFSVAASGTMPLLYQWRRDGIDVAGETSASLMFPAVSLADSGATFTCVVTNAGGSATSTTAVLSVVASPPLITQHPLDHIILVGQSASFSILAVGTPIITYQWQKNGVDIPGAITPVYVTVPAEPGDHGALFRCIVMNELGLDTSDHAVLIIGVPAEVVLHPINQSAEDGQQATFNIVANGTVPLGYQWLRNGLAIPGATAPAYLLTATMPDSGALFLCVVTNAVGTDTSDEARLFVNGTRPLITSDPEPQIVAQGQTATFSVVAIGTGSLSFQWQKNGVDIPGAIGSSYATPQTVLSDSGAMFRCMVTNYVGKDTSVSALLRVTRSIIIQVWYGKNQSFGVVGDPVPDINIPGNVTSAKGILALHYSLNGGTFKALSRGPDTRRLAAKGDFNIDIPYATLTSGMNQVVIRARDSTNVLAFDTVSVNYASGNSWPVNYDINWSTTGTLQSSAQVLDGLWAINTAAGTLRPIQLGYDRLVAIGEQTWADYEVTVPITIHRIDSSGYAPPSNGAGIGFLLRWPGHSNSPASTAGLQPKTGYLPLGALAWYSYRTGAENLVIAGNNLQTLASDNSGRKLLRGVRYIFKARVETLQNGGARYSLKVWADTLSEPVNWDVVGQAAITDPQQGSLLLVAHHVDASFGNVMIRPVSNSRFTLAVNTTGNGSVTVNPVLPDYPSGQLVTLTAIAGAGSQFQSWSGDLSGNTNPATIAMDTNKTVVATFISGGTPSSIVSENFNSPSLNTGLWTFINPRNDATASLNGNQLTVPVPAGTSHDVWTSGNFAPRIMQLANNVDFEIEAKFQSVLNAKSQIQGIIVQQDAGNFIRFDFVRGGSGTRAYSATFANGTPTTRKDTAIASGNPLFLRVRRDGSTWTQRFSYNGTTWITSAVFQHQIVVNSVGPFFGNAGNPVPAFTGVIDYFFNTAAPLPATGAVGFDPEEEFVPVTYALHQNYPNPFNPSTRFSFDLPEPAMVSVKVYDMLGREIVTLHQGWTETGRQSTFWQTDQSTVQLSTGVYVYRIVAIGESGNIFADQRKMILLK